MQKDRQRPGQPREQNSAPGLRWPPQKPCTTTGPVSLTPLAQALPSATARDPPFWPPLASSGPRAPLTWGAVPSAHRGGRTPHPTPRWPSLESIAGFVQLEMSLPMGTLGSRGVIKPREACLYLQPSSTVPGEAEEQGGPWGPLLSGSCWGSFWGQLEGGLRLL
ncbi:unnamed protein product [Rangifer tarandus platyrhynchus]|uniref:Uncharacterized protein n=2 Tax=Rangifer tarandus platyrhynchus TaxID=3082113 RepID=A0ACB0E6A2_RANTA|nr:unnamed protein product [Rangifer tarandus platyrhynchus]CAI9695986.1 unnamed protein product [Rangifer tarandus platyrhynchus]